MLLSFRGASLSQYTSAALPKRPTSASPKLPLSYKQTFHKGRILREATKQRPSSGSNQGGQTKEPKRGRWRHFYTFALFIPVGWYLSRQIRDGDGRAKDFGADGFVRYTLIDRDEVSSTCSIFTLKPTTKAAIHLDNQVLKGAITSVQIKQPQLQIARSYTLLPPIRKQDVDELRLLIREERNGEVSGYLHRLPLGAQVEMRGPNTDYVLPEDVKSVVFLAGGTGIAPAMQVAAEMSSTAYVHILWANRRREDCLGGVSDTKPLTSSAWNPFRWWKSPPPPSANHDVANAHAGNGPIVAHLEHLGGLYQQASAAQLGPGCLSVDYYVDEEGTFIRPFTVRKALNSTDSYGTDAPAKRLLFVSGPEGFVSYWAGPKQWVNRREVQGPLGGVLSTLDLKGWEVVKL